MSALCNGNIVKQLMVETSCSILSGDLFEECKKLVSIVSRVSHFSVLLCCPSLSVLALIAAEGKSVVVLTTHRTWRRLANRRSLL